MFQPQDKGVILYVDDEPKNLTSFRAVFRRNYDIYVATSASEGIEILENNPIQLVITDQRMPNITGVQFLEQIAGKYPDVTRVILTGYSDVEAIIQAINKGQVYKYITKPWKKDELQQTIDDALELHQLKSENSRLIEKLKKTNDELDRFVYSAAHDLRGPVASLAGLVYLAKQEEDCQKLREYISLKESIVGKMNHFIQEVIDFSRNTRLDLQLETIDWDTLLQTIFKHYAFYEYAPQVQKIVHIQQETPFITDKARIELVLSNLISNAFRFANPYREDAQLKIIIETAQNYARIQVEDNGLGIPEQHLSRIFDMFYRAHDQKVGSGLGLFLVKEALQKIEGNISVSSKLGEGTQFSIQIKNWHNANQHS